MGLSKNPETYPDETVSNRVNFFDHLEDAVYATLETYSNVHRGSGHFSMVTTHLFEQAREIILNYLELDKNKYVVIFCSPDRAKIFASKLKKDSYHLLSSRDIGLPLGVDVLAVERKALPGGIPFQAGGGTTRLIAPKWIVWAKAPEKFEAGTPAIINIIAFTRALQLIKRNDTDRPDDGKTTELSSFDILYRDEFDKFSGKDLLEKLRQTLIGLNTRVPTMEGIKQYINLDNGASTQALAPVWKAVCQVWRQEERIHKEIIKEVKSICLELVGAGRNDHEVIFLSNTTEAINLVAESLDQVKEDETVVLNTMLEHNSNDLPWRMLSGSTLLRMQISPDGLIDLNELDSLLNSYNQLNQHGKKRIRLVAVSGASNVLGVFNDLEGISRLAHKYGAQLLVDAAQLVAHRRTEMDRWGIDFLAFSGHKVYAPFGTGVLVAKKGLLNFSFDELKQKSQSGEENVAGIAALGKAMVLLLRVGLDLIREEERILTAKTIQGLSEIKGIQLYGFTDPQSPQFDHKGGVIVFSLNGIFADKIAKELAIRRGIGIRYGCHCAHILIKHLVGVGPFLERFQHLMAILFPVIKFPGLARVSLGIGNTKEDIDELLRAVADIGRNRLSRNKNVEHEINDFIKVRAKKVYAIGSVS